jgi:hypothetical protein
VCFCIRTDVQCHSIRVVWSGVKGERVSFQPRFGLVGWNARWDWVSSPITRRGGNEPIDFSPKTPMIWNRKESKNRAKRPSPRNLDLI